APPTTSAAGPAAGSADCCTKAARIDHPAVATLYWPRRSSDQPDELASPQAGLPEAKDRKVSIEGLEWVSPVHRNKNAHRMSEWVNSVAPKQAAASSDVRFTLDSVRACAVNGIDAQSHYADTTAASFGANNRSISILAWQAGENSSIAISPH